MSSAAAIEHLADSPDKRARMGEAGRALVAERFTLGHQADGVTAAYRAAVRRRRVRWVPA